MSNRYDGSLSQRKNIKAMLTDLPQTQGIVRIQLRRKDAAVVMTVDHYENMVEMKALYEFFIE